MKRLIELIKDLFDYEISRTQAWRIIGERYAETQLARKAKEG